MNPSRSAALPALLTDADVLERVRHLVGPASSARRLWIFLVDGDGRQSPSFLSIDQVPIEPDPGGLPGLTAVLGGLGDDLATDLGAGSVVLTLERLGVEVDLPTDRGWARTAVDTCHLMGVGLRGFFLSTPGGVRRLV